MSKHVYMPRYAGKEQGAPKGHLYATLRGQKLRRIYIEKRREKTIG